MYFVPDTDEVLALLSKLLTLAELVLESLAAAALGSVYYKQSRLVFVVDASKALLQ